MMLYVPFIFFVFLVLVIVRKRGLDASAYITMLFAVSSFFSILYFDDAEIAYQESCTFLPTIIYCTLISLAIWPVYCYNTSRLRKIIVPNPAIINVLVYLYFTVLVLLVVLWRNDIIFLLTFGDFAELRKDVYLGLHTITQYGGILGRVGILVQGFAMISFVMIPVFFLTILLKRKWWYQLMAILGSTSMIVMGVLGVDRSKTFYWVVVLGLCVVIFWKYLHNRSRKVVSVILAIFLGVALTYFFAVTNDRFEDSNVGVEGGLVRYAGESYVNFCYFFENYDNGESFSTRCLFPAIHHFVLKDYQGGVALQQQMALRTGKETGVFYTFLGSFIIDNNQIGPFVFMLLYLILFLICLHFRRRRRYVSFFNFLFFFFLTAIPTCGFISYIYTTPLMTLSILMIMILISVMSIKKR